jgi:hypothetical protein
MAIQFSNVKVESKSGKIVITIDPKADTWPSASGLSEMVASTKGNKDISGVVGDGGQLRLSVNCYRPAS